MNLGPISQSLILAGESPEVDVLARRALQVPAESTSREVTLQFTSVAGDADYAGLSSNAFMSNQPRSPLDLYRRVQRSNSSKGSRQLVDVFA